MAKWIQKKPMTKINSGTDLVSQLCNIKGISNEDVTEFLEPSEKSLLPAEDLKNSEEAGNRIIRAIKNGEKVVVSADNDVDGVTSTAIIIRFLQESGLEEVPYIYAERNWGHGIMEQIRVMEETDENEVRNDNARHNKKVIKESDLLIIVDSSSNDVDTVEEIISEYGTDVILLDHHDINKSDKTMEDIGAILVNPRQKGCRYINKNLSGSGVVYKMVGLINEMMGGNVDTEKYIDLAGVGIYSDMMRMDEPENRYLVSQALKNIKNMGLERILKSAKAVNMDNMDGDTIGFTIGPLINGTARMGNIKDAIDLLLTDDDKTVKRIRLRMHKANEARKEIQSELVDELTKDVDASGKMVFVITDESSSGMNGLIAQDIAQRYQKPAFVGRLKDGFISGSGRSYGGVKLRTFFNESGLVEFASGHEGALGVGFKESQFDLIEEHIEKNMEDVGQKEKTYFYDIYLDSSEVLDSIDMIQSFNYISGIGAPKAHVRIDNIMVEDRSVIGATKNTVKFSTMDDMELIKFRVDEEYAKEVGIMDSISVVGELKWNEWKKFRPVYEVIRTMQVMVNDYKVEY